MKRTIHALGVVLSVAAAAGCSFAQADGRSPETAGAGEKPAFEVISIKPDHSTDDRMSTGTLGGRFTARNLTAKTLIEFAYNLKDTQIQGGPSWIDSEKYDVNAKPEDSVVQALQKLSSDQRGDQIRFMVQSLLADRFKMTTSHTTKELPVFVLVVAKGGPKLVPTKVPPLPPGPPPPGPPPDSGFPATPIGPMMRMGRGQLTAAAIRTRDLVEGLSRLPEIGGRVILDQTKLTGRYDFTLQWAPEIPSPPGTPGATQDRDAPPADSSEPSLFTALEEQLGLRLESSKGPVDVLVIDHIEEPSPN